MENLIILSHPIIKSHMVTLYIVIIWIIMDQMDVYY